MGAKKRPTKLPDGPYSASAFSKHFGTPIFPPKRLALRFLDHLGAMPNIDCVRRWTPHVAILVLMGMLPTIELVENAEHLITEGHTAHATADAGHKEADEHEKQGDEHGCSGTFHVCSCHTSPVFLEAAAAALESPSPHPQNKIEADQTSPSEGHGRRLFRPPTA